RAPGLLDPLVPRDSPARLRLVGLEGLLAVPLPDVFNASVQQIRGGRDVPGGPHEDALRAHMDVDARVVPVEQAADQLRRMHLPGRRELLPGLAPVALAVRRQVAVVDLGAAVDEDLDAAADPGAGGVGEQEGDVRVTPRVPRLLWVAEAGGHVDARPAVLVIRRHRPDDWLLSRVDRRVLARDEV